MPSISELLKHTAVRVAIGVVAAIGVASLTYYLIESAPPKVAIASVQKGTVTDDVTATGVVSPVQNPVLSFESGGQVRRVTVQAGNTVHAGAVLATLDTGVLSASLSAAEARLNELESGPRGTDIAGQQTAVQTAKQSLSNTYTNFPVSLQSAETKAETSVDATDVLFDYSTHANPALSVPISSANANNYNLKITVDSERQALVPMLTQWKADIATANPSNPEQLQQLANESVANLNQVNQYMSDLEAALNEAQVSPSFSEAQQAADLTLVDNARDTVNGQITAINAAAQSISTQQLAIQSAQDSLNQKLAGASVQEIAAQQASVAGIEAQIRQQEIIAPFTGKVASVSIKPGDVVSPNTQAIALIPNGNFEVDVYLPENQIANLKVGNPVTVTLDAYGANRTFPASVATIETSPSIDPNSPGGTTGGYKVTVVFDQADPAIANGMHANVTIHAGTATNVLTIPRSAIITDGSAQFVLLKTAKGLVRTPVTIGLVSSTTAEVTSGLSVGDQISAVGSQ